VLPSCCTHNSVPLSLCLSLSLSLQLYLANSLKATTKAVPRGAPTPRNHTFLAEIERLSTEVKRCQFRLEQIISDLSSVLLSSHFVLGEMNDKDTAWSIEVWSLVGILFGSLAECLVSSSVLLLSLVLSQSPSSLRNLWIVPSLVTHGRLVESFILIVLKLT
jgi:hypothetical protein